MFTLPTEILLDLFLTDEEIEDLVEITEQRLGTQDPDLIGVGILMLGFNLLSWWIILKNAYGLLW